MGRDIGLYRIDRIKHDTRHRPLQILCVRVLRTQQTLDEREEAVRMASGGAAS